MTPALTPAELKRIQQAAQAILDACDTQTGCETPPAVHAALRRFRAMATPGVVLRLVAQARLQLPQVAGS
jgi:hypothetical protein